AVDPRSTQRIRSSPDHLLQETKSGLYTDLIMRQDASPTNNPELVRAMQHLLDREQIVNAVFRGYATVANDQPVPPGNRYYFAGLPQRVYDLDRARFALRKSGLLGTRLPVYCSQAAEGSVEIAALLQQSAAKAGL